MRTQDFDHVNAIDLVLHGMGGHIAAGAEFVIDFRHCRPSDFHIENLGGIVHITNTTSPWKRFNPLRCWNFPSLNVTIPTDMTLKTAKFTIDHAALLVKNLTVPRTDMTIISGSLKAHHISTDTVLVHADGSSLLLDGIVEKNAQVKCVNGTVIIHGMPNAFAYEAHLENGTMDIDGKRLHGGIATISRQGTCKSTIDCRNGTMLLTR